MGEIIKFKSARFTFEIPVSGKFNVILGKNGTGKSTLAKTIIKTSSNARQGVMAITGINAIQIVDLSRVGMILVIDEDSVASMTKAEFGRLNESPARFVFLTRSIPKSLAIDYRDIYEYRTGSNYYKAVRKYPDYDTFKMCSSYVIEGEPGKVEAEYCNKWLKNVVCAGGNSRAITHKECECAILDGAACGAYMSEVVRFRNVYLPVSFEERVYSALFREHTSEGRWWEEYPSLERYYYSKLTMRAKSIGIDYNKSKKLNDRILNTDIYGIKNVRTFDAARIMSGS